MPCRMRLSCAIALIFVSGVAAQTLLSSLGIGETEAKQQVLRSVIDGRVAVGIAGKAFKSLDAAMRVKAVQGALAWAKAYTATPAFKADYLRQRESNKPAAPAAKLSIDDELAKQKADRRKSLDEMKKNMEKMSPEMRQSIQATVQQMEQQFAKIDADPKILAMMRQSLEMQRAADNRNDQERVKAYNDRFPEDPGLLVARRLQRFLDVSKDVDFSAKVYRDGKMLKFMEPKYEAKPGEWKLCFRAGRDAVAAARTFAESWLKELGGGPR